MAKRTRKSSDYPSLESGAPCAVRLSRKYGERTKTGEYWVQCCDCGLKHHILFSEIKGGFVMRWFSVP